MALPGSGASSVLDPRSYQPGLQKEILQVSSNFWVDNLRKYVDHPFVLPFSLTVRELDLVNRVVAPTVVTSADAGSAGIQNSPSHAAARAVATVAARALHGRVEHLSKNQMIEIGCSPSKIGVTEHHVCSKFDARDYARMASSFVREPSSVKLLKAMHRVPQSDWCYDGVENCSRPALVAIAQDSLYDVQPEQIVRGFERHNLQVMYATLWVPEELSRGDGMYSTELYELVIEGDTVSMSFHDTAFAYRHSLRNWREIAFGAGHSFGGVAVIVETIQKWGPVHLMQFTRVHESGTVLRAIPSHEGMIAVPVFSGICWELCRAAKIGFSFRSLDTRRAQVAERVRELISQAPTIEVPAQLWSHLMQFVSNRKDSDVERNVVGSALTARCTKMEVAEFVLQSGHAINGSEHRDVCVTAMIVGCAGRMLQSQLISKSLNLFGGESSFLGFFATIADLLFEGDLFVDPSISSFARLMGRNSHIVEVVANCVDEKPNRRFNVHEVKCNNRRLCLGDLTSIGGRASLGNDGCWVGGENWRENPSCCKHGITHVNHVALEDVVPLAVPDSSSRTDNSTKSTVALRVLGVPSLAACAAPGNDADVPFARRNFLNVAGAVSLPLSSDPNVPFFVGGNVNCRECLGEMMTGIAGVYVDYGSPCEQDYPSPDGLLGYRALVKVRRGKELLPLGRFPSGYSGWRVFDIPTGGGETVIGNFDHPLCIGVINPLASVSPLVSNPIEILAPPAGVPEFSGLKRVPRRRAPPPPVDAVPVASSESVSGSGACIGGAGKVESCVFESQTFEVDECFTVVNRHSADPAYREGRIVFSPSRGHDCFMSAIERREVDRSHPILLEWRSRCTDSVLTASFDDPSSHAFVGKSLFIYVARKLRITLVIHKKETREVYSVGHGPKVELLLANEHFSALEDNCRACEKTYRWLCRGCSPPQFVDVELPKVRLGLHERDAFTREMLTNPVFGELHRKVVANVVDMFESRVVHCMFGVAGSGKTHGALGALKGKNLLVLAPTKALAAELQGKYKVKVKVWSSFCAYPTCEENILIDEVFLQHPIVLSIAARYAKELYLIGDPMQRTYGGQGTSRCLTQITEILEKTPLSARCSRSVPLDVCSKLSEFGVSVTTHSRVTDSIQTVVAEPRDVGELMTFSCEAERKYRGVTVAKSQGRRFLEGSLYLDHGYDHARRARPARDLYVAFTRHVRRLTVYCRSEVTSSLFSSRHSCWSGGVLRNAVEGRAEFEQHSCDTADNFTSTAQRIERTNEIVAILPRSRKQDLEHPRELSVAVPMDFVINNDVFGQQVLPGCQPIPEKMPLEPGEIDEIIHSYNGHLGADVSEAEQVLSELSPTSSPVFAGQRHLKFEFLGSNFSRKKFSWSAQIQDQRQRSKALVTGARLRGRECRADDYSQTLQTMLGRYSKKVGLLHGSAAVAAGDDLFAGLLKVLARPVVAISSETLANAKASQISRIADKKEDQREGIFGTEYSNTSRIKFFLKQQVKSDLKVDSHLRGSDEGDFNLKPGQGISAQPKTINHIVGAYVSAAERAITCALDERVRLGYGLGKPQFRMQVKKLMQFNQPGDDVVCCDISEQDTSKGPWTNHYMRRVYRLCGVPEQVIDLIECANVDWTIDAKMASLRVKHKYQSGRADTLFANTMMNIGLIMSNIELSDLRFALFQGDDSYVRAARVTFVHKHENLKIQQGSVGDFVGFVVGDRDIYLDIPRFVVKLMNKSFADDEELSQYRLAVYDWLSIYCDAQQLHEGFVINAHMYGSSSTKMALLFSLMREFYLGNIYRTVRSFKNPNGVTELITEKVIKRANRKNVVVQHGVFGQRTYGAAVEF